MGLRSVCHSTCYTMVLSHAPFLHFSLEVTFVFHTYCCPTTSNRDAPLNSNGIVNFFIAICQGDHGDHSITKSLLCLIYPVLQVINCFAVFSQNFTSNYNIIAI